MFRSFNGTARRNGKTGTLELYTGCMSEATSQN